MAESSCCARDRATLLPEVFEAERDRICAFAGATCARLTDEFDQPGVDMTAVTDELRDLWKTALEREGTLASAVADVVWKATPYGETEDGDVYAYIVPKGAMHRLVGVAQSNGAHVPVAFRSLTTPPGKETDQ